MHFLELPHVSKPTAWINLITSSLIWHKRPEQTLLASEAESETLRMICDDLISEIANIVTCVKHAKVIISALQRITFYKYIKASHQG